MTWSEALKFHPFGKTGTPFAIYLVGVVVLACISCALTLTTRTVVPSAYRMTTFDENLAAELAPYADDPSSDDSPTRPEIREPVEAVEADVPPPMIYYSAAGSGVAEVRVILSGFVLHGFLGLKTLAIKSVALILSVASGLSLGKEGPYVHIATCVGNIACRLFLKYDQNDAKRREVLSAAAAAGVAVAFGAPLGGVLFGLEEVSYFFPAKTLFRTFFCCIVAALSLKFLNPYGTHKIVMFQVKYVDDWHYFEIFFFIAIGVLGGAAGALFIKASKHWAKSFRRITIIKTYPMLEVLLVAIVTGIMSYWNVHTKQPVAKLMLNLAAPCRDNFEREDFGLCPTKLENIPPVLLTLFSAFLIKGFLTIITFGIVSNLLPGTEYGLTVIAESPRRYLRPFHGSGWFDGQIGRPCRAIPGVTVPELWFVGCLCCKGRGIMHPAGRLRPDCCRLDNVRCYSTFGHTGRHPLRAYRQSGLRVAILFGNSRCQVDGGCG